MSVVKHIQNHLIDVHKLKLNSKAYKMCLANTTPHEVDVVDPYEPSESVDVSDSSVSSSEDYKPVAPPKKKNKSHENDYDKSIYGSSTDNSDDSNDVHAKSSNDKHEGQENEEPEKEEQVTSTPVFDAELKKIFDNFESWLLGGDGGSRGLVPGLNVVDRLSWLSTISTVPVQV